MIDFEIELEGFDLGQLDGKADWIAKCIEHRRMIVGNIQYILMDDEQLLVVNKEHLNHDYYTDIITFDYSFNKRVSGDIFVSVDRVRDNAETHDASFEDELDRVLIHGVLHLMGLKDKTESEAAAMRAAEEECLLLRS